MLTLKSGTLTVNLLCHTKGKKEIYSPQKFTFQTVKRALKILHILPAKREDLAYTLPLGTCCESLGTVNPSDLCRTLLTQF